MNPLLGSDRKVVRGRLVRKPLEVVLSIDENGRRCYSVKGRFCAVVYYKSKAELFVAWLGGKRMGHFTFHYAIPKFQKEEFAKTYTLKMAQSLDQSLSQELLSIAQVTVLVKNLSASYAMLVREGDD